MPRQIASLPLSYEQDGLWLFRNPEPGDGTDNVVLAMEVHGPLNLPALEHAVNALVARHDALRTTFSMVAGQPQAQVVSPALDLYLTVLDLTYLPAEEREARAVGLAREAARACFDLERGPLLRMLVYRLGPEKSLLVYCFDHIIMDRWSISIFCAEIDALYREAAAGTPAALPPPSGQYPDHVAWQRDQLTEETLAPELLYWRSTLAGAPLSAQLPTDRPRAANASHAGGTRYATLPASATEQLELLSRQAGISLHVSLLAAFQVLLMRHGEAGHDRPDIVVGAPSLTRRMVEEDVIGYFINTLVMRADLSGDPTFREALGRVRETAHGAYDHQDLPFGWLSRELSADRTPIVQVLFDYQSEPITPSLGSLRLRPVELGADTALYDLALTVTWMAGQLHTELRYRDDLFTGLTMERWLARWLTLLESIAADPDEHIGALRLLPEDEQSLVLTEWSSTKNSSPEFALVHQWVEEWARRAPDRIALVHRETRLTYHELNTRANRLAHLLHERGVGSDVGVGVYADRSVEAMLGMLAVLKAGGYYIPLEPSFPGQRIRDISADTTPRLFLAQIDLAPSLATEVLDSGAEVIPVDPTGSDLLARPGKDPQYPIHLASLGYVLHTSGSTGRPKGVAMPHSALVRIVDWYATETGIAEDAKVLQFSSLGFDASFCEIFGAWRAGARLILLPHDDVRRDPEALIDLMEREGVEHLEAPYSALLNISHWVVHEGAGGHLKVRTLVTGGEQLIMAPSLVEWIARMPGCAMRNGYGPSESSVATTHWLRGDPHTWPLLPPIGRPITNARVYLLDEALQPVPIGVTGELFVGGEILARGYLGRPALTAERFVADPVGPPGARLYRTGDYARYRAEGGVMEFLGRVDHQVKIRGHRVELGEIEARLAEHPQVRAAVVTADDDKLGRRLIAYVVPEEPDRPPQGPLLEEYLRALLPGYMVPGRFVGLEALPLTASGKVDRAHLPQPGTQAVTHEPPSPTSARAGSGEPDAVDAALSPTQRALVEIWRQVFGTITISLDDDFFDLGGHSLLATQVISLIRDAIGRQVRLSHLFEYPTIAELAELIDREPLNGS